jgi:hypothetical protein
MYLVQTTTTPRWLVLAAAAFALMVVTALGALAPTEAHAQTAPTFNVLPTATPATADVSDPNSGGVELGMRFRSSVPGYVAGVRFYKGTSNNSGTHVGHLWNPSATATPVASVTFSGETSSGWQEALFATPVAISANTDYVVSYYAPNNHYSVTENYFTSNWPGPGASNPLTALQDSAGTPNGVYAYGSGSTYPSSTLGKNNYYVDIVFLEYTLFGTLAPSNTDIDDPTSGGVQLGTRFKSSVAGYVHGVRFYKGSSNNSGTHVGQLWDTSGNSLATATFSGETSSGWQEVLFATPVAISANTDYVVSYYAPNKHYSVTENYFTGNWPGPGSNNSLTAVEDSGSVHNGLYAYGSSSTFPSNTYGKNNYFVDVIFSSAP